MGRPAAFKRELTDEEVASIRDYAERYVGYRKDYMSANDVTQPARGMRDFLPEDVRRREYVVGIVRGVYDRYGFEPLETPAAENIETLLGKYGEEGNKLIFKILKRGEHEASGQADLALRYDLTVPLARVVAEYQSSCRGSSSGTRFSPSGAPIGRRAGASASSTSATSTASGRRRPSSRRSKSRRCPRS